MKKFKVYCVRCGEFVKNISDYKSRQESEIIWSEHPYIENCIYAMKLKIQELEQKIRELKGKD